jgi:WD40 repeat protein
MGGQFVLDRQTGQPLHAEAAGLSADFLGLKYPMAKVYTDILSGIATVVDRRWLVNIDLGGLDWNPLATGAAIEKERPPRRNDLRHEQTRRVESSPNGRQLATFRYHPDDPGNVDWPAREEAGPWVLEIVDAHSGSGARNIWNATAYPSALEWSPDGAVLALALAGGGVRLWRTSDWTVAADIPTGPVARLSFGPDGGLVATWQVEPARALVGIIDVATGRLVKRLPVVTTGIDVVLMLSGSRVALGLRDGTVAVVDAEAGAVRLSGGPDGTRVVSMEASDDRKTLLVTRLRDGDFPLCTLADAEFGHDLLELQVNGEPTRAAAFLAGARGVVLASDEALYTWSMRTGQSRSSRETRQPSETAAVADKTQARGK